MECCIILYYNNEPITEHIYWSFPNIQRPHKVVKSVISCSSFCNVQQNFNNRNALGFPLVPPQYIYSRVH